jgi:hypothetical protein
VVGWVRVDDCLLLLRVVGDLRRIKHLFNSVEVSQHLIPLHGLFIFFRHGGLKSRLTPGGGGGSRSMPLLEEERERERGWDHLLDTATQVPAFHGHRRGLHVVPAPREVTSRTSPARCVRVRVFGLQVSPHAGEHVRNGK